MSPHQASSTRRNKPWAWHDACHSCLCDNITCGTSKHWECGIGIDISIRIISSGTSLTAWKSWGRVLKNVLRAQSRRDLGRNNILFLPLALKIKHPPSVIKLFTLLLEACFSWHKSRSWSPWLNFNWFFPKCSFPITSLWWHHFFPVMSMGGWPRDSRSRKLVPKSVIYACGHWVQAEWDLQMVFCVKWCFSDEKLMKNDSVADMGATSNCGHFASETKWNSYNQDKLMMVN